MGQSSDSPRPRRWRWSLRSWVAQLRRLVSDKSSQLFRRGAVHLATLAMAVLTISLLVNFVNQVIQSANLEEQRATLATEVALLEAQNQQLEGAVEYAESDVYVERIAREQLGYARDGDTVVLPRILEPTPAPSPPPHHAQPAPTPMPNWERWWQAFVTDDTY